MSVDGHVSTVDARMLHRTATFAALLVLGLSSWSSAQNVILLVVDDAGPELFGAYDTYYATVTGQPSGVPARTPAIDAMLAAHGVTFTHAWVNPSCSPTRSTLLTGRYAYRTGVGGVVANRPHPLRPGLGYDQLLLPQALQQAPAPYRRVALGKWHLAEAGQVDADPLHPLGSPPGSWFDAWAGTYFNIEKPPQGLDPDTWSYSVWTKSVAAQPHWLSVECAPQLPPCQVVMSAPPMVNFATANTAEDAIQCLRGATSPLFLYVAFNAIHAPHHEVPGGLPTPTCAEYTAPVTPCEYPSTLDNPQRRARCMLEALDQQIGRILCEVDFDTTHVVLIGDNGSGANVVASPYPPSHGKSTVFEGGVRAPLIVRSPAVPTGMRGTYQSSPVNGVDIFATVCDLIGVPTPARAADSVSMLPYLTGPAARQRDWIYTESFFPNFTPDPSTGAAPPGYEAKNHQQAISDGRFKLHRSTRRHVSGTPQFKERFFDLAQGAPPAPGASSPQPDFFEAHDLLLSGNLSQEAADALATLRGVLDLQFPYFTR